MVPDAPATRPAQDTRRLSLLGRQLRWLIGIRLLVITSAVLPLYLLQGAPTFNFLLLLAGLTYAASLVYIALLRLLAGRPETQAHVQFFGDLLLTSGLVYYFGGVASPFSMLYFVVIIVAAAMLPRRAGVTVAGAAWVLYAAVVLSLQFGWIAPPVSGHTEMVPVWRLTYSLATHLFGFYAVALLTSRLAQSVARAELELKEKREHLADLQVAHRDVIESIPSGLITCDVDGTITSANKAAQEILGQTDFELVGRSIAETGLFPDQTWQAAAAGGSAPRDRRELVYRRGEETLHVGYAFSPLTNADLDRAGFILIFQDLSRWRKLQEELRLKDRMAAVGELASGLAHELGNPLAAISGSVQMLSGSLEGESSQRQLVQIILKESQRLDRTIKSFLKFARPRERSDSRFDIARLLRENVELLRNSAEVLTDHRLQLELDPPSVGITADRDQISQIFWNLARNALRAMPGGGILTVAGTRDGDNYQIRFSDSGHGMTAEERANLFHPFRSFFDGGTGIGMAIVYRIVQEHGGRLHVESEPGEGTTIAVELPIRTAAAVPVEVPA